jgi:glycosyltransferase involved in cell wall biosynthesis
MPPTDALNVALLTGGADRPYAFGLATALMKRAVQLDLIAGDELRSPEFLNTSQVKFLNLRGDQTTHASFSAKTARVLLYYVRLIRYAFGANAGVFHILWNNKFEWFDRTILMLYYRLLSKNIVLTVHNVNAGWRDGNDSFFNHYTLKAQYRLAHHIFVHTEKMKTQLCGTYAIAESRVSVIPFGINNAVPRTELTRPQSRDRLGLEEHDRVILFFGTIAPYKGLEHLVSAFHALAPKDPHYRLIVAGRPRRGSEGYWQDIEKSISEGHHSSRIVQNIQFIPDEDTELYFKAADVVVLPYLNIFQSGVLFLAYSFGLPVVAADVGDLKEDIVEGETGFICRPADPANLALVLEKYFASPLFATLATRQASIRDYANEHHSWDTVATLTTDTYSRLLSARRLVAGPAAMAGGDVNRGK